jgi:choline-sulfatase
MQPDILLFQVDQLAAQWLPVYGHPLVRTPNLDALAAAGVVFETNYCNAPLCSPSRFSMLTGCLPSRIGAYDNAADFSADLPTVAHHLRLLGYRTVLSGKTHFCGPDQLHGFEKRLTTDIYPSDYGWTPDWENPAQRPSWYHNMVNVRGGHGVPHQPAGL